MLIVYLCSLFEAHSVTAQISVQANKEATGIDMIPLTSYGTCPLSASHFTNALLKEQ